ncbi:MAG: ATP-binding protein, partial [Pirellulaceae bacterium]|nr:ATP-binding protein [Pirellulaceae bacterium]
RLSVEDVAAALRTRAGQLVAGGVTLVRPVATWKQLILPAERLAQLREAVARIRHQVRVLDEWRFLEGRRGARGVRVLLSGPPGTGKSLSAEVLAHALGVDLLHVDLSRVVSKWIGETEKNLSEAFAAAERSRAVLLFDEADALFGKRTDVGDAQDRYANLETAYLLTRLEHFEGLAILSTNLRQNIDSAFTRRMEFVVEFEKPDSDQRLALWKCHLPDTDLLADDVHLPELAAYFPLVGGLIRNAAVSAAFAAAEEHAHRAERAEHEFDDPRLGQPRIRRSHFMQAIRREYDKSGQPFPGYPGGVEPS